jgi:predicted Zn-dependent protease
MRRDDNIDVTLRTVTEHANTGSFEQALALAMPLLDSHPNDARVLGVSAGVLWRAGRLEEAVGLFARAASASPKSELASLGLFHCLWGLNRPEEAKAEVARFLSIASSREYDLLLEEMGWRFDADSKSVVTK